jgi:DNA-binding NtrC family response regulator
MKKFTLVIVDDRTNRGGRKASCIERPGMKMIRAESVGDADFLVDTEDVDLMLVVPNSRDDEDELATIRSVLGRHRELRVMFFGDERELEATLSGIESLHPEQQAGIFFPVTAVPDAVPVSKPVPSVDLTAAQRTGDASDAFSYADLIGESPEMRKLKSLLVKIAPTGTTILLQGESGTGKEVIGRSIHYHSSRSDEAFIPVDCAAISENIIESELFGHAKGAFTGADRATLGLIRSADKGTLFLDEIGELPLTMQAKLLRTLQERAVKPVGDTRIYPVDIRIVAATNRNLAEAVKQGTFRQDLYYRLNAITIYAPQLRERRYDIPLLCEHVLTRLLKEGYPEKRISSQAMDLLCAYDWPGNIRELENVIRRAVTLANGTEIDADSLSIEVGTDIDPERNAEEKYASVAFHEKEAILKALNRTNGNRKAAAELLDISEATLYRRLKMYSL